MKYIEVKRDEEILIYDLTDYSDGFGYYIIDNCLYYGKCEATKREATCLGEIKMKKKIRDLTLNEMRDICLRNHCFACPLQKYKCVRALDMWLDVKDDEIEVEEK